MFARSMSSLFACLQNVSSYRVSEKKHSLCSQPCPSLNAAGRNVTSGTAATFISFIHSICPCLQLTSKTTLAVCLTVSVTFGPSLNRFLLDLRLYIHSLMAMTEFESSGSSLQLAWAVASSQFKFKYNNLLNGPWRVFIVLRFGFYNMV